MSGNGGDGVQGSWVVSNSLIADNGGRGLRLTETSSLSVSTVSGNRLGGILNTGDLTVANSTIVHNRAEGGGGGINNAGSLSVTGSTITRNRSATGGGGLYSGPGAASTLSGSIVLGNAAATGMKSPAPLSKATAISCPAGPATCSPRSPRMAAGGSAIPRGRFPGSR